VQGTRPLVAIILVKFHFLSYGAKVCTHTPEQFKVKFGRQQELTVVRSSLENFTLIGAMCRPYGAKNPKICP